MTSARRLPAALVNALADALASYHTHGELDDVFARAGAPGDPPQDSKVGKCRAWLWRVGDLPRSLEILGLILEEFLDAKLQPSDRRFDPWQVNRPRVVSLLTDHRLEYRAGGILRRTSVGPATTKLTEIVAERGLSAVEDEIDRAVALVDQDPAAAVTSACAALEALCKAYLETRQLALPSDQSPSPLWNRVRDDLGLDPKVLEEEDLRKILGALPQLVQGIAALRTHAGSAHGRGSKRYRIEPRHARLAVNASHALATFLLETMSARETARRVLRGR
jgi:hypothetical protein